MRRSTSALTAAVLGTALSATSLVAQQAPLGDGTGSSNVPASVPGMRASRGARYLLRNGWDYLKYQEYERALSFFNEASQRKAELNDAEKQALAQGLDEARRGIRDAAAGTTRRSYAKSGTSRPPGAITVAQPQKAGAATEPIQLTSGTNTTPAPRSETAIEASLPPLPVGFAPSAGQPAQAAAPQPVAAAPAPASAPPLPATMELEASAPPPIPGAPPVDASPAQTPAPAESLAPPPIPGAPPESAPPPTLTLTNPEVEPAPAPAPASVPTTPSAAVDLDSLPLPPLSRDAAPPVGGAPAPPAEAPPAAAPAESEVALPPLPVNSDAAPTGPAPAAAAPASVMTPEVAPAALNPTGEAYTPPSQPEPVPTLPAANLPPLPEEAGPRPGANLTPVPGIGANDVPQPPPSPANADGFIPERSGGAGSSLSPHLQREVERIVQKQEDELRQQGPPGREAAPAPEGGMMLPPATPSTRLEITRAPSPTEARPIRAIPVPDEFVPLPQRDWPPNRKYWSAAATCHLPLYFQDASLERYGHSTEQFFGPIGRYLSYPVDDPRQSIQRNQITQPMFSIGLFAAQIALLPYNLIMDPPWEAEYDLGYYRPGDRIPTDTYYLPLSGVGPPLYGKRY